MLRDRSTILAIIVLTVATATGSSLIVRKLASAAVESSWVAFTAKKVEKFYDPAGRLLTVEESLQAVRSDGSKLQIRRISLPNGQVAEQKALLDLSASKEVYTDGLTESVTTSGISARSAEALRRKPAHCGRVSNPARATLLGYEVVKVEKELPGPPGELRRAELWLAPALDCFPLKDTLFVGRPGGEVAATNFREVISVALGEPDPSLFEVPVHYVERSPSEVLREFQRRYPTLSARVCPTCPGASIKDQIYWFRRQTR